MHGLLLSGAGGAATPLLFKKEGLGTRSRPRPAAPPRINLPASCSIAPRGAAPSGRRRSPSPLQFAGGEAVISASGEDTTYQQLLQRAEENTFTAPSPGDVDQLEGRRSALQDGERMLDIAMAMRPKDMAPRVMLLRNLMLQDQGREADVPALALASLRELSALGDDIMFSPAFVPAMQIVLLALKAYHKLGQEARVPAFVNAASQHVPAMSFDFDHLAERVDRTLSSCSPLARADLLNSHRYLSCVDLQFVNGLHHQGSPGLESEDAAMQEAPF